MSRRLFAVALFAAAAAHAQIYGGSRGTGIVSTFGTASNSYLALDTSVVVTHSFSTVASYRCQDTTTGASLAAASLTGTVTDATHFTIAFSPAPTNNGVCYVSGMLGGTSPNVPTFDSGTALPASCVPLSFYLKTDTRQLYTCNSSNKYQPANFITDLAANRPTACDLGQLFVARDTGQISRCSSGGNPGTWSTTAGASEWTTTALGNITGPVTLNVGAAQQIFTGTLLGDVTFTASGSGSATFLLALTQGGIGSHAVTYDASFSAGDAVDPTAGAVCYQAFVWNGTAGVARPQGSMSCPGAAALVTSTGLLALPAAPDTLVGRASADTLTNKTISGASNTLTVREADLSLSDVLTGNASAAQHGFVPKLPGDAGQFYNGAGTFSAPSGSARYGQLLSGDSTVAGLPITDLVAWDDFLYHTTTSASIGDLGWVTSCTGGYTGNVGAGVTFSEHPGVFQVATGATSGQFCLMLLGGTTSGPDSFPDLSSVASWETVWIIYPLQVDPATTTIRVGLEDLNQSTDFSTRSFHYVGLDSGGPVAANFYLRSCNNATTPVCNAIDTGVAPVVNHWYKIRMFSTVAGTIQAQISDNGGAYSSPVSVAAGTAAGLAPAAYIQTGTTAARGMNVDYWGMRISGLSR